MDNNRHTFDFTPPSVNACYRTTGSRVYKSARLREFQKRIGETLRQDVQPIRGKVRLDVELFYKDNRKRDIDNPMKALIDSLEYKLFENDSNIFELHVIKNIGCGIDRTVVTVTSLE